MQLDAQGCARCIPWIDWQRWQLCRSCDTKLHQAGERCCQRVQPQLLLAVRATTTSAAQLISGGVSRWYKQVGQALQRSTCFRPGLGFSPQGWGQSEGTSSGCLIQHCSIKLINECHMQFKPMTFQVCTVLQRAGPCYQQACWNNHSTWATCDRLLLALVD